MNFLTKNKTITTMYIITHHQLFKGGRLIADQRINLIVPNIETVNRVLASAQKRYKHRPGDYKVKLLFKICDNETVGDCGTQLKLF